MWTSESGGVVAEGDHLTIGTVSLIHSGLYTCTVSSLFSTAQATLNLIVLGEYTCPSLSNFRELKFTIFRPPLERLEALIEYDDVISPTHEVSFHHGDGNSPSFRCLVNGSVSETTFTWQVGREGGEMGEEERVSLAQLYMQSTLA